MNPSSDIRTPTSAAQRGAQWLIGRQQPDGSLSGATSINEYYKAPFGLTVNGCNKAADRMLDYVARTYLRPDGDLDGSGCAWFDLFPHYPHGWLIMASVMRGRFELVRSLLPVLLSYHDPRTGGFFQTAQGREQGKGVQEVMTTSLAGLASLWAGRLDIAREVGAWLENLFAAQPDLSRGLYFIWDSETGLTTDFPPEETRNFLVDASQTAQRYYQYGISAALLCSLSAASGESRWLELARRFLQASRHCREDRYRQPQSGKIGWGAAWTYRLSGEAQDRDLAEQVADGLQALQDEAGWWSVLNVYQREMGGRPEPGLDVTGEFVGLLGCIELVLS